MGVRPQDMALDSTASPIVTSGMRHLSAADDCEVVKVTIEFQLVYFQPEEYP
jgi:hypothetical protein